MALNNPHWDAEKRSLFYADLFSQELVRYSYDENKIYTTTVDGVSMTGFFMPVDGSDFEYIVGTNTTTILIHWNGCSPKATKVRDLFNIPASINTGLAGPAGNIYVGAYGPRFCSEPPKLPVYDYRSCGCLGQTDNKFVATTGTAIDIKRRKFYQVDGCQKTVTSFDVDPITGKLCKI